MSYMYYNGQEYKTRPLRNSLEGYFVASLASAAILSPLPYIGRSFQKQLSKEIHNNHLFKDGFKKALEISGLKEKGLKLVEAQNEKVSMDLKLGYNAAYDPVNNKIIINTDKISAAGFHELGHAMNELKSKFGSKYLAMLTFPGYLVAGLMEYFAIFSRKKPEGAPRSPVDYIEDNCGKIAFLAMMPTVIEEAVASYRGINLAKKAGISDSLLKSMKKIYFKAHATYSGKAVLGGLAVYASRKIMDAFTRPKPVEESQFFGWY